MKFHDKLLVFLSGAMVSFCCLINVFISSGWLHVADPEPEPEPLWEPRMMLCREWPPAGGYGPKAECKALEVRPR